MDLMAGGYKPLSAEERFWKNAPKGVGDSCWLWGGKINDSGYGIFTIKGRSYRAHRIAWQMHHARQIPDGLLVRHRCDVRACVNPEHLVVGDHSDNRSDAIRRHRANSLKGEAVPSAKLTTDQVQWARQQWDSGLLTKTELSRRLGVSVTTVTSVVNRESWTHVK